MYVCMYVTLWISDRICCGGMGRRGDYKLLFLRTPIVTDGLRDDAPLEMTGGGSIVSTVLVVLGRGARSGRRLLTALCRRRSWRSRRRTCRKHLWKKKYMGGHHMGTEHRSLHHGRPHRGMHGRADYDSGRGCNVRREQHLLLP